MDRLSANNKIHENEIYSYKQPPFYRMNSLGLILHTIILVYYYLALKKILKKTPEKVL